MGCLKYSKYSRKIYLSAATKAGVNKDKYSTLEKYFDLLEPTAI